MKTKRYILVLCLLAFVVSPIKAQSSVLSVGVRGGGQMMLPTAAAGTTAELKPGIGAAGTFDLRYTFYGHVTERIGIGSGLGVGAGYGTTSIKGTNTDAYSNTDYLGNQLDYTVNTSFSQSDRFVKAEASLLLAFRFGGVTLNVGPRLMMPFASSSSLTVKEAHIDAYYPLYNVHVPDELITGYLETPTTQTVTASLPKYNVLMALELGYEWRIQDKHCLGVQLFADVAVWSQQSSGVNNPSPLIVVGPITDAANPVPAVSVNADAAACNKRYIDFGVRAYYAFDFGSRRNRRASGGHDHRNRFLWYLR